MADIPTNSTRGGRRKGAGRKPAPARAGITVRVDTATAADGARRRLDRPELTLDEAAAWLRERHGSHLDAGIVKAWRCLLQPVNDDLAEGEDGEDPFVGYVGIEDARGQRWILTRARLHAWAKAGKTGAPLRVPFGLTEDRHVRQLAASGGRELLSKDDRRAPIEELRRKLIADVADAWTEAREAARERREHD